MCSVAILFYDQRSYIESRSAAPNVIASCNICQACPADGVKERVQKAQGRETARQARIIYQTDEPGKRRRRLLRPIAKIGLSLEEGYKIVCQSRDIRYALRNIFRSSANEI